MPNDVEVEHDADWGPALSEQFAKADAVASEAPAPTADEPVAKAAPEAAPSTESAPDGRGRDAEGRFVAKKPGAASNGNPPARASGSGAQDGADAGAPAVPAATAAPAAPPAPTLKPPQSWKPAVRELAAKLPPEFRPILEEAVRRDREAAVALQSKAEAEKGAGVWGEVVRPYEAQFRQAGVQPQQYVGDLLRTAHALNYAQPQQRLDTLGNIIMQFGSEMLRPDQWDETGRPSSNPLDRWLAARLSGQAAQPQQQAPQPQFDKEALLQEVEQRVQSAAQQRVAEAELVKVAPELEYFEDLREDMAAVLDAGLASDYKEAHALALQLPKNSDTLALVRQKEAATSAANAQASTQRAKAASSSVRSTPGGGGNAPPDDKEDEWGLNSSWDRAAAGR